MAKINDLKPKVEIINFQNTTKTLVRFFDKPYTIVKSKTKKALPIILITLFCVAVNLYWLFHQDARTEFFVQLNLLTVFTIILAILFPAIKQQFKDDKKNKIK